MASHTYDDDHIGAVRVELSEVHMTDEVELTDDDTAPVIVYNVPPVVDAGPDQSVNEGDIVSFSGIFADPGINDTHIIEWDFGDGSPPEVGSLTPTHAYGDNGSYTVTLTVTDDDGGVGTDTLTVLVSNVAPTTTIDPMSQPNPQFILPGVHTLTFVGSFTDPGWLDTHEALWNFGDGTVLPGTLVEENVPPDATGTATGTHVYWAPGMYTVSLEITDDDGAVGSHTMDVVVVDEYGALEEINNYIQGLPDSAFKSKPDKQKNTINNMIVSIWEKLDGMEYQGAIKDLQSNLRGKADGSVDGKANNDWIVDPTAQTHICMKIDDLTAYLDVLLALL